MNKKVLTNKMSLPSLNKWQIDPDEVHTKVPNNYTHHHIKEATHNSSPPLHSQHYRRASSRSAAGQPSALSALASAGPDGDPAFSVVSEAQWPWRRPDRPAVSQPHPGRQAAVSTCMELAADWSWSRFKHQQCASGGSGAVPENKESFHKCDDEVAIRYKGDC